MINTAFAFIKFIGTIGTTILAGIKARIIDIAEIL